MGGGSGKAGDSLVDFMDGGDGDSMGGSDEEGTAGPYGRAAVKLEEKQGAQQTLGAGAALPQCCLSKSSPLGCITDCSGLLPTGKAGPTAGPGAGGDRFGASVCLRAARLTGQAIMSVEPCGKRWL